MTSAIGRCVRNQGVAVPRNSPATPRHARFTCCSSWRPRGLLRREEGRLTEPAALLALIARFSPLSLEMLAQRYFLALVIGVKLATVEAVRTFDHPVKTQLTYVLAMLDGKLNVVRPYFKGRPASVIIRIPRVIAESGIEEACIMRA
jgi:hypothetical protein